MLFRSPRQKLSFPDGRIQPSGKPSVGREEASAPDYYKLKLQAVEDLVTANAENSPPVSRAELKKYHAGPRIRVADWIKALLLKAWFAGVVCYFFILGLSTLTLNQWDHLLILGIVLGGITHLLTNNIYRFIAPQEGVYDRWMMFPKKHLAFLPLDILYAVLLVICTVMTYNGVNLLAAGGSADGSAVLGVEPVLFGVIVTLWDLLFLGMKRLALRILRDAKLSASGRRGP